MPSASPLLTMAHQAHNLPLEHPGVTPQVFPRKPMLPYQWKTNVYHFAQAPPSEATIPFRKCLRDKQTPLLCDSGKSFCPKNGNCQRGGGTNSGNIVL
ncbi:hypothetical protein I7I48_11084 [Histoplasma ohiense]|nr:hypothetical protein I7I48_11084 [Histoplasma ohiense (nom. inval.)]